MKTKIDAILIACALPITANAGDTLVIIDGVCVAVRPAAAVPAPKPAKAKGNADVISLFPTQGKRAQQRAAMARLEAGILRTLASESMNARNLGLELKTAKQNNIGYAIQKLVKRKLVLRGEGRYPVYSLSAKGRKSAPAILA